ncbi:MAG: heme o synthase [Gammaproteobacteria bacterium]|nr:heme o synthase [Gammaproteobacteria bacterium]
MNFHRMVYEYWRLTKPRVNYLILFCSMIGMLLAIPSIPKVEHLQLAMWASLGIWLIASSAAVYNCILEEKTDKVMKRTAQRATVTHSLSTRAIVVFAVLLYSLGSAILFFKVNTLTFFLTTLTFFGYSVVYTLLLKPVTPQNIVIGGLSGAMPPALGWVSMTDAVTAQAWVLVLIIFLWTPPHFWALSLYRVEDYKNSGLPMLPVTHGAPLTRLHIFLYSISLFFAAWLPYIVGLSGGLYLFFAMVLSALFCRYTWQLWREYSDALARKTFKFSITYLSAIFASLLIDHYWRVV